MQKRLFLDSPQFLTVKKGFSVSQLGDKVNVCQEYILNSKRNKVFDKLCRFIDNNRKTLDSKERRRFKSKYSPVFVERLTLSQCIEFLERDFRSYDDLNDFFKRLRQKTDH